MRVIGIDPGLSTGIAIYQDGALQQLETISPWDFKRYALDYLQPDLVVLEDSTMQAHVFTRGAGNVGLKIARNIGEIDAWCKMIKHQCGDVNMAYLAISPKDKGAKRNAAEFERITGWTGASNQHTRDAAMVAWAHKNYRKPRENT